MFGSSLLSVYDALSLPSPMIVSPAGPDLMAAVVATLRGNWRVAQALGDTPTQAKVFADAMFSSSGLPYLVYSEPEDKPLRVFGGATIGQGTFDAAVFDTTKEGARSKLRLVRAAINGMPVPANVGDGTLIFIRSIDDSGKDLKNLAPTPESDPNAPPVTPQIVEFGRVMTFAFKIVRNDP